MKIGLFGLVSGSLTCIYAVRIPSRNSGLYPIAQQEVQHEVNAAWPYAPFTTKGRDVVNKRSEVISWAGVNWPMSGVSLLIIGRDIAMLTIL